LLIFKTISNSTSNKAEVIISSVIIVLLFAEIYFIVSGANKTYLEKVGGNYFSPYTVEHKSHYHKWSTNENEHWLIKPEYKYWRPTNSLGYADNEWKLEEKLDKKKIICIGDSFTEGDGADFDSSYVAFLKRDFFSASDSVYIMNAGIIGSDPFFDFIAIRDILINTKPNIIIQTISTQDLLTDIILRGGMERFENEQLKYLSAPWWEPIYALSYTSRLFFNALGYNELLRKSNPTINEINYLNNNIIKLLEEYSNLCKKNNIELILILRPDREEIMEEKYLFDFSKILKELNKNNLTTINLLPCYLEYIKNNKSEITDYFWKYDGHHNAKGYKMMANCIYKNLK